jgi:hypothetical protein
MEPSKIALGMCGFAAAVLVAAPLTSSAAPRKISIKSDGTSTDVTSATITATTDTTTTTATTSTVDTGYYPTLSPTYTPAEISWANRKWRVNAGATWTTNMGRSVRLSQSGARIRFQINDTTYDHAANEETTKRRAEISGSIYGDSTRLPNGQSLWGAFSTRHAAWADPAGMKLLKGGVYGQIHMGNTFGGSPAVAFRRKADGKFRITTRGEFDPVSTGTVRYEGLLSFDQVHDIVYNTVLHPTAGSLKVWIDGVQVVNVSNVSIGHSSAESYWAFGAYFAGGVTSPVIAEYANHVYPAGTNLSTRISSRPAWPSN